MAQITVLDSHTIDKIAAGEVVERPKSVVKELVENAIDANATAVTVEIKEGGLSFIRITDNGQGIDKSQVKKAFLRHATSKIKKVEDLFHVTSLGFRGEALSSISSVSQVELITKTKEDLTGVRYCIDGGIEISAEEIGAPNGTTFLIRNLFYNTPVRRNFLKSAGVEGGHISDLMEHLALSKPNISFTYIANSKTKFHTTGNNDLKEVIYRIYGREIAKELIPIQVKNEVIDVKGYLGKPSINRGSRNFENYFVNHRYLKNDLISKAIEESYQSYMMQHKYPFCVLHFTIDPRMIDINVHPTKMDVRFTNQAALHKEIVTAIVTAIKAEELIPEVTFSTPKEKGNTNSSHNEERKATINQIQLDGKNESEDLNKYDNLDKTNGLNKYNDLDNSNGLNKYNDLDKPNVINKYNDLNKTNGLNKYNDLDKSISLNKTTELEKQKELNKQITQNERKVTLNATNNKIPEPFELNRKYNNMLEETSKYSVNNENRVLMQDNLQKEMKNDVLVESSIQLELFEEKLLTQEAKGKYRILGQLFGTYWIVAFSDKMFLIDQHAAHEKVNYERLLTKIKNNTIDSQLLDPPIIVSLTGKEKMAYSEYASYFVKMGFTIEEFGGNEYAIRSVPTELFGCHEKTLFEEIIDELSLGNLRGTPKVIEAKIASMSCKAAIKGNTQYTTTEIEFLLEELLTLENPYHCPHGRPTIISMSKYEIEKKFKRIV